MIGAIDGTRSWLPTLVLAIAVGGSVWGRGFAPRPGREMESGPRNISPIYKARPLPLSAVRLTGGPLKRAQDMNARYLLELEPDRMLAFYRQRAGLQPKAQAYGGWDGDGRNLTGHIAGHYLSAVSLMWAATGDPRFKQRADYIVDELEAVQRKNGDGYVGAVAGLREAFADLGRGRIVSKSFDLNALWSPWYTLHKTYAGLRDAYRHTGNRRALEVEIGFAEWAERVLAPLDDAELQRMLNTEFGGMNEILADLYVDTGDTRWLALSYKFEHRAVLDPLKRGEDPLAGIHGNTQVPKLLGSAVRYTYKQDPADGVASRFFWERVVNHHTFATGGHGKDEYFREPDRLSNIVDGRTSETCNVYNMLKLTRLLFALEPRPEYAEFQERALFNHILGSMDPDEGSTCYMVPVGRGVRREYQEMLRSFTCCVGTGMESHALHGDGIYYEADGRFWVNLYVPSIATWPAGGASIETVTDFPEGETANIKLTLEAPKTFTLALRRPSWAADGFRVTVNGEPLKSLPSPRSYVEVTRLWKTGDRLSLVLPKALHLEPLADNDRRAAILWGPLVLAGDLGPDPGESRLAQSGPPEIPALVAVGRPVDSWVKPAAQKPGSFRTEGVGRARDVDLVPFYRLHRRTYAAYWDLLTPSEYDAELSRLGAERERLRALEEATLVKVPVGVEEAEKPFNPQGEGERTLRADGWRPGRRAAKWFSYDVAIDAARPIALVVTYNSDTWVPRSSDVLVNGRRVGHQTQEPTSVSRFFDVEYAIPPEVVQGAPKLTVRFESTDGNETASVFGVRVIHR